MTERPGFVGSGGMGASEAAGVEPPRIEAPED